jgi:hypothetical protein
MQICCIVITAKTNNVDQLQKKINNVLDSITKFESNEFLDIKQSQGNGLVIVSIIYKTT